MWQLDKLNDMAIFKCGIYIVQFFYHGTEEKHTKAEECA